MNLNIKPLITAAIATLVISQSAIAAPLNSEDLAFAFDASKASAPAQGMSKLSKQEMQGTEGKYWRTSNPWVSFRNDLNHITDVTRYASGLPRQYHYVNNYGGYYNTTRYNPYATPQSYFYFNPYF